MADISFADTDYNLGRRRALSAFDLGMADVTRQRGNLGRDTQRSFSDLSRAYRQAAPQQITQFTNRGLGRSGLYRQSMIDFALQQERDRAAVQRAMTEQQSVLDLQQQGYEQALNAELARLEQERLRQIAADAAALKSAAPLI